MKTRLIRLTLACLLAAAPATAQVNYGISGNTAYVAYSPNASGDVVIASTFNGYPVTHIGQYAFSGCTNLTSAFYNCSSLTNVTYLPNWQPIWTNTVPGASADFVDPDWLQQPRRFYRARSD